MILLKYKVQVLTADPKPYSFDGRSGTSFKARVLMEGDVYALKCTEEQLKEIKAFEGKSVEINVKLSSPKEVLKVEFDSFVEKK